MENETAILQRVRLRASELGAIVWRNNTGKLQDVTGRWVQFGLCTGSSDLIGIYKGRFLAIEVKAPGKEPTPEQLNFIQQVKKAGGVAGGVTSPDELENVLNTQEN